MSSSALKLLAASGAKGEAIYVDDLFSTFLYAGTGAAQGIQNGINLGDFGSGTSTKFAHNTDFLSRSSDLTGNADGKTFTFSCWVFPTPKIDDNSRTIYATDSNDNGVLFYIQQDNTLGMEAWNGGVRTLQLSTTTVLPTNAWTNILVSLDFANSSNRYIYFNDAAAGVTYNTYNNANVEFTRPTHYVGIWGNGTTRGMHNDNLAHLYLDYTYRDLSTESNRRIFIDANGGSTAASTLTALNPIMYLPMTTAYAVGKNAGTGGDFTVNGSPTIEENGTEYVAGSGEGGLTWIKSRTHGGNHNLIDTVRGSSYVLESDGTGAQGTNTGQFTFNNNGFTINNVAAWDINQNNQSYVSWSFRKAPGFFDIVTYTGNGTARAINHNLGSIPGFMVVKKLNSTSDWTTYHRGMGATKYAPLNDTDAYGAGVAIWNNTEPTSTQFTVGDNERMNNNGDTYVAYLFAHDAQDFGTGSDEAAIKCGSYTGNGSTDGPTIDLGFEPQWLLIKNATAGSNWMMVDNMRGLPVGGDDATLAADTADAENGVIGAVAAVNILPNGWKNVGGVTASNANGATHIYMAIRRPNKPAEEFAATDLFGIDTAGSTGDGKFPMFRAGFPVDMGMRVDIGEAGKEIASRLASGRWLYTNTTAAESQVSVVQFDYQNGWFDSTVTASNYHSFMWRRAPGYFDVVTYTGTGSVRTQAHNLGAVPEMVWIKKRAGTTTNWIVYTAPTGSTHTMSVNASNASSAFSAFNNTNPTSTVFTLGTDGDFNGSTLSYIAYLFATVAGISKVGSYTGTGNDLNVDCGFSAGARFILIKRTDGTGDWYVWDSVRGIVSGNDPYTLLNTTAAQVTNTDYIDPLASGFTVTSSAPAALNNNGGTYIFYAIA